MARAGGSHPRRPGRPELRGRAAAAAVEQLTVPAASDWSEASFSSRSWKCSNTDMMPVNDTTSFRQKSIGKVSIRKPSVRQLSQFVKYVSWSSLSIGQVVKLKCSLPKS